MSLQDDDDFEQVKVGNFDMALRKNISSINGKELSESRDPEITIRSVSAYLTTGTGIYYHTKAPIKVKLGDTVTYTIRVYNEGYQDGYAKQIVDYLPNGLELKEDSEINAEYGWEVVEESDGITKIATSKLKDELIPAANGAEGFGKYLLQQSGSDVKD